jgi:DNA-directed RNA polymerase subunit L
MQVKEVANTQDSYGSTCLQLEISGKNVCYQTLIAIRKASINQIPIYAFHPDKINITRNSSVYDNSEISCNLSQLPITNFHHQIKLLPLKYYKNVNFADGKIERHPSDIYQINYSMKAKNDGPEPILFVTTNDLTISITSTSTNKDKLISDEIIPPKEKYSEKYPITLIKLRAGEEFECSMKGVLAVGELDGIFNASNTYWKQLADDKFLLSVESNGQLSEYEILIRACEIIIEKLILIKENLDNGQYNMMQTTNNSLILEILNEDHTCGSPLNWIIQSMKEVTFAGVNKPDFMQKIINSVIQCDSSVKAIDLVSKAIAPTIKIYEEYKEKFEELYKGITKKNNKAVNIPEKKNSKK